MVITGYACVKVIVLVGEIVLVVRFQSIPLPTALGLVNVLERVIVRLNPVVFGLGLVTVTRTKDELVLVTVELQLPLQLLPVLEYDTSEGRLIYKKKLLGWGTEIAMLIV